MEQRTIFSALSKVQSELAAKGISKDRTNTFDNYKFRGIDDVLNTLAPILSEHKVLIMPSVVSSEHKMVTTSQGKPSNHWKLVVDYHFYDEHGDTIVHRAEGECMDRGDKGLNKAVSAAFKYMLFQAFCIPLQGQDADSESPELGVEYVSGEQQKRLLELLTESNTEATDFVSWITKGSETALIRLPAEMYDHAVAALEKKLKKMAEEYAAGAAGAAADEAIAEQSTVGKD